MDKLSFTFPARSWEDRENRWDESKVRHGQHSWSAALEGEHPRQKLHVVVFESPGPARWYCRVEGNPARWVDPEGVGLCPADQVPSLAAGWVARAGELVAPGVDLEAMAVTRLDVARDFQVTRPGFYVQGLRHHPRPYARHQYVHHDPARGGAQTLVVGSGAGTVMLYDKHEQSPELAPPGTLRWETEARKGWLAQYGKVLRLCDVRAENVHALAEDRWEWSAMGADVSAANVVVEKVKRAGLPPRVSHSFLGWLLAQSCGEPLPVSKEAQALYRRLQRELGVSMEPGAMAGTFLARLDFETGTEVLRVA